MNEIVKEEQRPALNVGGPIAGLIPRSIEEVFRLSNAVVQAGMAPYGLETPQKATVAILTGLELGLPPMQALQSIAVINNRPCIWGDGLIAVVRKSPLCLYIKEWVDGEGDNMVAYCETHRKGEFKPELRSFSVADARKAGLWQTESVVKRRAKNGETYEKENDSPWWKYPRRMLAMRARSWCLRDVYADVTKGLQVREEVEDYSHQGPDNARDVTPRSTLPERLAAAKDGASAGSQSGFSHAHVINEIDGAINGGASQSNDEIQDNVNPNAHHDDSSLHHEAAPAPSDPASTTGGAGDNFPGDAAALPDNWQVEYVGVLRRARQQDSLEKFSAQFWDQYGGREKYAKTDDGKEAAAIFMAFEMGFGDRAAIDAQLREIGVL